MIFRDRGHVLAIEERAELRRLVTEMVDKTNAM